MKGYRCDNCRDFRAPSKRKYKSAAGVTSKYDGRPKGWVEVEVDERKRPLHFCSHACAMLHMEARASVIEGVEA